MLPHPQGYSAASGGVLFVTTKGAAAPGVQPRGAEDRPPQRAGPGAGAAELGQASQLARLAFHAFGA